MTMHANEIITNKIISELEKGIIPWEKPWFGSALTGNAITKKPYSLMNQMLLTHHGLHFSFKQLQEKKGTMVKPENWADLCSKDWDSLSEGQRFSALADIVMFYTTKLYEKKDSHGNTFLDENGKPKMETRYILKYYRVVWEGYTSLNTFTEPEDVKPRIDSCDELMKFYSKREHISIIEEAGSEAFYRPITDSIHLPKFAQFKNPESYYGTAFHEMTHSTGNKKRLDRDMTGTFGTPKYAREELTAELGSAFLTNKFGIRTDAIERNNVAYIQSWIKALKKDPDLILRAASKAEKAVDFITDGFIEPEPIKEPEKVEEPKKEEPKAPRALLTAVKKITKTGNVAKLDDETWMYLNKGNTLAIIAGDLGLSVTNKTLSAESLKRFTPKVDALIDCPDLKKGRELLKTKTKILNKKPKYCFKVEGTIVDLTLLETAVKAVGKNARIHYITGEKYKPIMVSGENGTAIICPMRAISYMEVDEHFGYLA